MSDSTRSKSGGFSLSPTAIILIVVLVVLVLFLIGGCTLKCNKKSEGYKRSELGQRQTCTMGRSPVDYAESEWQANPHYQARPSNKYQPLEYGPVDLYFDQRKLSSRYPMFSQYRNDYKGCADGCLESGGGQFLTNDTKGRFDLRNIGDVGVARQMDYLRPLSIPPQARHDMNAVSLVDTVQTHLPYGFTSVTGD